MNLGQLLEGEAVQCEQPQVEVSSLAYDSRRVLPGALFVAWAGVHHDGHAFIDEAVRRGAAAVLCERPLATGAAVRVVVADARRVMGRVAARFYGMPHEQLRLVGVTGTNGKTTTVHLLEAILHEAGFKAGMIGTLGSRYNGQRFDTGLTTPESVELLALLAEMRAAGVTAVAMETSSHALAQGRVGGLCFDVGVVTNVSQDHLDFHGTMENYLAAKAALVQSHLKPGGCAVLNMDDARVATLPLPGVSMGFSARGEPRAAVRLLAARHEVTPVGLELELTVAAPGGTLELRSGLIGSFNIENILAAVAAASALELAPQAIVRGVARLRAVPGRLERVSGGAGEPLVVVDYAHTPDALAKALQVVRELTRGRLVCVFGCGGNRDPFKRKPMGRVAGEGADLIVLTNDNPRDENPHLIAGSVEEGLRSAGRVRSDELMANGYMLELDRAAAITRAIAACGPQDTVLIAGKGHETYQIIGAERLHFDDREEARRALDQQRYERGAGN